MVKIGTTHNLGSSLRVWLVTLPDQHLTRPCLADHVLGAMLIVSVIDEVDLSLYELCAIAFKTISVKTFVF